MKYYFKKVNDDREPLMVTNQNPEDNVVVLSKDEYDALTETLKIESNEYVMGKIRRGQKQVAIGKAKQHGLTD